VSTSAVIAAPRPVPADLPTREVPLPRLLVVADSAETAGRPLVAVVREAVAGGARAVWLRDKASGPDQRRRVVAELAEILHDVGGLLIASPGPGTELADGCQLGAGAPPSSAPGAQTLGRSCHDRSELARAAAEGCGWATLSPIFASGSKPGYGPALGLGALSGVPLPTWALGGVGAANAGDCLWAGAAGVAVMGAVLRSPKPAGAVAAILARLEEAAL